MPNPGDTSRYIIRAVDDGAALTAFIASLQANAAVRLVDTIGPAARPHTVVVETDAGTAQQLEHTFRNSNQLMIEPDRPLSLFD